jgi:hypothetical protein
VVAVRTTDQSKRTVRVLAIGGAVIATAGMGVAFASNPYPKSTQPLDPRLVALQQREKIVAAQAQVVNQEHDALWREYRLELAQRQGEISDVNAWNARVRATLASSSAAYQGSGSGSSSSSSSSSAASPSAGYVYSPPVVSSRSS